MNTQKGSTRTIVVLILIAALCYGLWYVLVGNGKSRANDMPAPVVVGDTQDPNF